MSDGHPSGAGGAHPAPWREVSNALDNETHVEDANGDQVIGPDNMSGICFASPAVRELVLAAPEMAGLLLRLEYANDGHCPLCGTGLTDHSKCELGILLKRLDEARAKAGG